MPDHQFLRDGGRHQVPLVVGIGHMLSSEPVMPSSNLVRSSHDWMCSRQARGGRPSQRASQKTLRTFKAIATIDVTTDIALRSQCSLSHSMARLTD